MRAALSAAMVLLALGAPLPAGAEMLLNTPVYNPQTKSYFELYTPDLKKVRAYKDIYGLSWRAAWRLAPKLEFHGVKGRLAVVKSHAVSEFLKDTFKPDEEAWIGLRYWCKFHKLQWVTGDVWKPGDFSLWGRVWDQPTISPTQSGMGEAKDQCNPTAPSYHLGVHYWRREWGFYWNANGQNKHFNMMFVEYPTGGP
jgi:hypothetical protein